MITCPVCEKENSENSQNCKECGFTLKYVKDGYHINISDEEVERYQKDLEEARRKYNPTVQIPPKDMFEKSSEYSDRISKMDIKIGEVTLKDYCADEEIFTVEYKLFPLPENIKIENYPNSQNSSIKIPNKLSIPPKDAKKLYEQGVTHPLTANFRFENKSYTIETLKVDKFILSKKETKQKPKDNKSKVKSKPKPSQRFIRDDKKGVVIDNKTGLMWQDDYSDNGGEIKKANWEDAHSYCKSLRLGGYGDWRLPTIDELRSIVDKRRTNPVIDRSFTKTESGYCWSSTTVAYSHDLAWIVYFWNGYDGNYYKDYSYFVRCVRDGE